MRLIDADTLWQLFDEMRRYITQNGRHMQPEAYAMTVAMTLISSAPTVEPEPARVLTKDEMTVMGRDGGAVYIEEYPAYRARCCWALVTSGVEPPKDKPYNYPGGVWFNATDADCDIWDGDFYGLDTPLGWRAWTAPPTVEQRRDTPWK